MLTQASLDVKKSYVVCIELPLVLNRDYKFLGGSESTMKKAPLM